MEMAAQEPEPLSCLRARLGRRLRVLMDDGRVIEGEFQCMDKDLNFIIGSATEYHGMANRESLSESVVRFPSPGP